MYYLERKDAYLVYSQKFNLTTEEQKQLELELENALIVSIDEWNKQENPENLTPNIRHNFTLGNRCFRMDFTIKLDDQGIYVSKFVELSTDEYLDSINELNKLVENGTHKDLKNVKPL